MANRRMFAKSIIDKDAFVEMPHSTQLLYFHLGMNADDDGFLDNYNGIMRNVGCKVDDLKLLVAKGFLICFTTGVVVIRDWRIHNQIRKDRYRPTKYQQELQQLQVLPTDEYALIDLGCQFGNQMATKVSIGKVSIGKSSICTSAHVGAREAQTQFTPPTVDEVQAYCNERNNGIDAQLFVSYYDGRGWTVGKNNVAMKDWRAIVRYWERNKDVQAMQKPKQAIVGGIDIERRQYSQEQINKLFTVLDEDE